MLTTHNIIDTFTHSHIHAFIHILVYELNQSKFALEWMMSSVPYFGRILHKYAYYFALSKLCKCTIRMWLQMLFQMHLKSSQKDIQLLFISMFHEFTRFCQFFLVLCFYFRNNLPHLTCTHVYICICMSRNVWSPSHNYSI